jgi:hypothetical protein
MGHISFDSSTFTAPLPHHIWPGLIRIVRPMLERFS